MSGPCNMCDGGLSCCGNYLPGPHGEMTCCDQPVNEWTCNGLCHEAERAHFEGLSQDGSLPAADTQDATKAEGLGQPNTKPGDE